MHDHHLVVLFEDAWQARYEDDKAAVDRRMAEAVAATESEPAPAGEASW